MNVVPATRSIVIQTKLGRGTFNRNLFQKCYYAHPQTPAVVGKPSKKKHVTNGSDGSVDDNGNAVSNRKRPVFQPNAPTHRKPKWKGKK